VNGLNHAFETTLGGTTTTRLLKQAGGQGMKIRIVYVGLNSIELHRQRVEARANRGGHPIDESIIRARLTRNKENLIRLLLVLHELRLYDNSNTVDVAANQAPAPELLLHLLGGSVMGGSGDIARIPDWAKPVIVAAAKVNHQ